VLHNQDKQGAQKRLLRFRRTYTVLGRAERRPTERVRATLTLWFGTIPVPGPRLHRFWNASSTRFALRVLNHAGLEGMKSHGYIGGFELAGALRLLFCL